MDHPAVVELVEDAARLAAAREAREAGAAGADAPRGHRHPERRDLGLDPVDVEPPPVELFAEGGIVAAQAVRAGGVRGGDDVGVDPCHGHCSYRVKACTLPASTLMMFPVDLAEASETRKYVASAMSSGSTERFSSERWRYISSSPSLSVL